MSRDYKTSPKSASKKGKSPLLTGLLIGLFAGLAVAVGIALYIKQMPSPFTERVKPAPEIKADGEPTAQAAAPGSPPSPAPQQKAAAKPRFDFYNILPGSEEPISEKDIQQAKQQPTGQEVYFLQAGAFQSEADADNLKAKLALLNVEATIQTASLPEKGGVWHRVRIGPFNSVEEAAKVRTNLAQNKVETSLIKIKDAPQ